MNVRTKKKKYGPDIYDVLDDTQVDIDGGESLANFVTKKKKKKKPVTKQDEYIEDEDSDEAEMTPNLGTKKGKMFPTTGSTGKEIKARKKYLDEIE